MIELYQLIELVTFSEQGTLSKTAEQLHLSQPALTRSMQKLERELNVPIFIRQKNKIHLNPTGHFAVKCASKIIAETTDFANIVQAYAQSLQTISVGSCSIPPTWELFTLLSDYFPNKTISTETRPYDTLIKGLENEKYQLIITKTYIDDENIVCEHLCNEHLYLSLPPKHPLSHCKSLHFEDISGGTILLMAGANSWNDLCRRKIKEVKFMVKQSRNYFDYLATNSSLLSFTTDLALKHERKNTNHIMIPILNKEATQSFYISAKKAMSPVFFQIFCRPKK
ncbi:MAG: LysR family transcriptional regulator [Anaerovoracaceae bacterium]